MVMIHMLSDEEMQEAGRLADAIFREPGQRSMVKGYPYIFSEPAQHVSFGAFEEGRLLSFMGLVPWHVWIGEAKLRVFSLGSVCTHPDARGRGYASAILQELTGYIRRAGASLLLVSGARSLYTRAGCAHFGRTHLYSLSREYAEAIIPGVQAAVLPHIREMNADDLFAMQELASSRSVRYELSVGELAMLIKAEAVVSGLHMNHRVLVAEQDGAVTAFLVLGIPQKAGPTNGLVIESAGDPEAVIRLAGDAVIRFGLPGIDFHVPWHETGLHERLAGFPSTQENMAGTVMIVDGEALITQLAPWFERQDPGLSGRLRIERQEDGQWRLETGSEHRPITVDSAGLIGLLFDNAGARDPMPTGAERLRHVGPVPFPSPAGLCFI